MTFPLRTLRPSAATVALGNGLYYVATGVWPLVHMRSFEAVTGPKEDRWLVQAVGGLVGAVGVALLVAGVRRRVAPELRLAAAGCALALTAVDVVYVRRRRIPPVYLADAAAEIALLAGWAVVKQPRRRGIRVRTGS